MLINGKKCIAPGSKCSKRQVLNLKKVFDDQDKDKNGVVTIGELVEFLKNNKLMASREQAYFRVLDKNSDGVITFDECLSRLFPLATPNELQVMLSWVKPAQVEKEEEEHWNPSSETLDEMKRLFNQWDANKDGVIGVEELYNQAEKCGYSLEELEDLFVTHDKNADGVICFDEFVHIVRSSFL